MISKVMFVFALGLFSDCKKDDTIGWVRFNAEGETLSIEVQPGEVADDSMNRDLNSTTGAVVIGTATVSPATGPVGTEHVLLVDVQDDFAEDIGRVTLDTLGDRGDQRHELVQDSADHGLWQVKIRSLGAADESRTDTFTVQLWRPVDDGETPDEEQEGE